MPQRITIFGEIGPAVSSAAIKQQLEMLNPAERVHVEINSEGGNVQEACAIYNTLRTWPAGVDVEIVGWALSAATFIAMAGTTIRAHETSLLMVHKPWSGAAGNADALRQGADLLDMVEATRRTAYGRTGKSAAVIAGWLDGQDHWFTAEQALETGLLDEVIRAPAQAAAPSGIRACKFPLPPNVQQRISAMPHPNPNAGTGDEAARAEGARIEARRRADIRAMFDRAGQFEGRAALQQACEDDVSCTLDSARQRLLASIGSGTQPVAGRYVPAQPRDPGASTLEEFRAAAVDVLLARGGVAVREMHPAARDLQRMSVVGMAEHVLSMLGKSTRDMTRPQIIEAALSTSDFPALLANTAGKALRTGYQMAPATFTGWSGEREVADFKQQSLAMLSEAPALQLVRPGADYTFGDFADSSSTFTVATYGKLVRILRQALINDDLGAFTGVPQSMGQAARRLEADMVYTQLTSNPTLGDGIALFHASHGNLGAAAAPSVASLGAARAAMRKQKGIKGLDYIDPQPRYLIVPVELETSCEQLLASLVDPSKSNDTTNVEWIRGLTLVADPRLDAVSNSQWYLAAAPQQVEGIIRAYIMGEERPFLAQDEGFTYDAVTFKVRLDVTAGVIDFRALYRNG